MSTPDQAAAHQLLTELRTRISTQSLPYQFGVEADALKSMWQVFDHARNAIKANPGCDKFADETTRVLNQVIRPLTAKWHRAFEEGRLGSRDGADAFRGELRVVQGELRQFANALHHMAYGTDRPDQDTPQVMDEAAMNALFATLPFAFRVPTHICTAVTAESVAQIAEAEAQAVALRREKSGVHTGAGTNAIGLALSGGGIRSATFGLGVVQVLAAKGFLKEIDFLSTVSGGGYTGSFLTQRLESPADYANVAAPHGPDPDPIRYLRQRARFLSASNLKEKWSMVTATLAGMLLNWTAPLFLLMTAALLATAFRAHYVVPWPAVFIGIGGLCFAAMVIYGIGMRRGPAATLKTGRALGWLLAGLALAGVGWALGQGFGLVEFVRKHWTTSGGVGALAALSVSAVPGIIRFLPVLKDPAWRKLILKVALILAGILVPLAGLIFFYLFCAIAGTYPEALAGVAVLLGVISYFVVNINLTAPHRLYRDGLARTFIQKTPDGTTDVKLTGINASGAAPYHILNAALNVPASESPSLKDRGCDFFMFSRDWCGAASIGYHPTAQWKGSGQDLDLATAMAVSGAAFSSYMGLGSVPSLTALLTLLNVRLGYWIKRPASGGSNWPGFVCLLRETFGIGLSEKADWWNLSDGGHIENMAVYELLRRRCKFIVCVDGEADPDFTFHGLLTLVRHAQIDFGIRIAPAVEDLRPVEGTGLSKAHFHLCRIHYPEGIGLLLYIKLSVTGNESALIQRYRINNPDFPHQTTLDQFFDQEQFEAYRQLGVHAAEGLFLPALIAGPQPVSVPDWFRKLAGSLLQPMA